MAIKRNPPTKKFPKGGFKAEYRDHAGRSRYATFEKKGEAEAWIRQQLTARDHGQKDDPKKMRQQVLGYVTDWAETYSDTRGLAQSTRDLNSSRITNHLAPYRLAKMPMGNVTVHDVERWLADMKRGGVSGDGIYRAFDLVARAFRRAHSRNDITSNVFDDDDLKASLPDRGRMKTPMVWTPAEIIQIAECSPPWYRAFILTLGFVGLRKSEAAAIALKDIDWDGNGIHVHRSIVRGEFRPMKNQRARDKRMPNGYRPYMIPFVKDALVAHIAKGYTGSLEGTKLVFGAGYPGGNPTDTRPWERHGYADSSGIIGRCLYCGAPLALNSRVRFYCTPEHRQEAERARQNGEAEAPEVQWPAYANLGLPVSHSTKQRWANQVGAESTSLAIPGFTSQPRYHWPEDARTNAPAVNTTNYKKVFDAALRRAGLPHGDIHDLRHSAASYWISGLRINSHGDPVMLVADQLGDSPEMIRKTYGHLLTETREAAQAAISDAYEAVLRPGARPAALPASSTSG